MRIDVSGGSSVRRSALFFRRMAHGARSLYPLANKARERWHESEERRYADRAGWAPRKPSTVKRYRYPVKTINGVRKGRAQAKGVGYFTGSGKKALTRPHQPGIKDRVHARRGSLQLEVGVKGGRQPRTYLRWFEDGSTVRAPRPLVVFDDIAARDLGADTRQHILPGANR